MKKFSKILESVWGDLHSRGVGELERDEEKIRTNINDIQPVDVGNDIDVFWADRDLEINEETELTIDQVKGFEQDGWRLPTIKEADDLLTDAKWVSDKGSKGWKKFYKIGITHMSKVNPKTTVYFDCEILKYSQYWEAEAKSCPDDYWSIFSFKQEGQENLYPHSAYGICKITDKCRVRLVKSKSKNIKESVWGDLHSRGIGEIEREEDDVNLLDDMAFTEYLKDTYTVNDPITSFEIYIDGAGEITLPVFEYDMGTRSIEFMYYTPKEKKVLIGNRFCHWDDKLMDKIKKTYTTFKYRTSYIDFIRIYPKKGEINNSFFLEVLNFILENANRFYHRLLVKNIKESVWGDLHSRGIGELEREEDDVNLMDMDSFAEYLNERYKTKDGNKTITHRGESWVQAIIIPFYKKSVEVTYILEYCYKNKKDKYLSIGRDFQYVCPDVYNALVRQFDFQDFNTKGMQWAEKICPKDGSEVTNNFVVKVLDFITSLPLEDNKLLIERV